MKVVGRGNRDDIIWIQAKEDNNSNSGYSFSGTAVQMENLTLTSTANGFYTGFPGAASTSFNNVEILVDHEKGAMGYWGNSTATFTNCSFITPNHVPESNIFAYGGETFIFSKCHFISEESSIKLYRDKATTPKTITIKVDKYCTFKSTCEKSDGAAVYKSVFYMHMDHASTDYNHYDINVAKFDVGSIEEGHNVEGNFADGYSKSHPKLIGWKATATNESYYSDHLTIKVGDNDVTDLGLSARPTTGI